MNKPIPHSQAFFDLAVRAAAEINQGDVERMTDALLRIREGGGRLFLLGVGGSAANCAHAVNDFRKLCNIETYAPTDNVSELTARINDEGWETVFAAWLKTSRANEKDAILVMSVGGGNAEKGVSVNIIRALDEARNRGLTILGIVGRDGGYTAKIADVAVIVPTVDHGLVTPLTEAFQSLVWHCLVSHPKLQVNATKW